MSRPSENAVHCWGERTTADLSSLLVELARVLRGFGFYAEGDQRRTQLLDRAFLAHQVELERAGPLEVWIEPDHFRAAGISETLPHGRLQDLAQALRTRGVERFRFDDALTRDAFHAFGELLERDADGLRHCGGFEAGLAARSNRGIRINGEQATPLPDSLAAASATASLGSALLARTTHLVAAADAADEKPEIDADPLGAPAENEPAGRQLLRLIELDRSSDDDAYRFLGERIVESAIDLFDAGQHDECYRAMLVLSGHAVGEGGRSGLQARTAQVLCTELASGARLDDLIARARSTAGSTGLRATQVLLQLGDAAVGPLLDRLTTELNSGDTAQLTAILIVLGDAVVPHLEARVRAGADQHAALAVRLAGELQNPALVPTLAAVLRGPSAALRRDAARALAHIGGEEAGRALVEALSMDVPDLPETVAHCLGAMAHRPAVAPLLAALDRALRQGETPRCRELIRALGQLGEERAVPKLAALLERRRWLRRGPMRELKLTSLGALERLPGREANRALERATRSRDPLIRRRATELLEARNENAAEAESGSLHSGA